MKKISVFLLAVLLLALCACKVKKENITPLPPERRQSAPVKHGQSGESFADPDLVHEELPEEGTALFIEPEEAEKPEEPEEPAVPGDEIFCLSFVGDCTLGTDWDVYGGPGTFVYLTGDDYGYPFKYAKPYFESDDFTLINLECALTDYTTPNDKEYCFRGPSDYAKILSQNGVECASLANNHSGDYGLQGLEDTKAALEAENVAYVSNHGKTLYETDRGLKIGVCAYFGYPERMKSDISSLRESGAQIVIAALHFGDEGCYTQTGTQIEYAHMAIDAGADIVVGSHPHVLQKAEQYNGGVIYYSLGNFSFGGNRNPRDKDTAIMRQYVVLHPDGTAELGETVPVPFRLSSTPEYNDYCPVPYEKGSEEYDRVMGKLDGSIVPPSYASQQTEEKTDENSQ